MNMSSNPEQQTTEINGDQTNTNGTSTEKYRENSVRQDNGASGESQEVTELILLQMFERETKREKILEARQREIRLKERSRSQQSREEEAVQDDSKDSPDQLIARAEREFYRIVGADVRPTNQARTFLLQDAGPNR